MNENNIKPEKITKPIQLLAVWFSGLVILVGLLLTAAKAINDPIWIRGMLCISSVSIIPLFLLFIFLMQTKYRPQMQDDSFYSKYLDQNTKQVVTVRDDFSDLNHYADLNNSFIEFSNSMKEKVEELNGLIKNINQSRDTDKILKLTESLNEEVNKIDDKNLKNVDIELNSLLPNFNDIFSVLVQSDFDSINLFKGADNSAPTKFVISIGKSIEPKSLLNVIELIRPLQNDIFISFIGEDNFISEKRKNQIVIGSYAYDNKARRMNKIDEKFLGLIKLVKTKKQFQELIK